MAGRGWSTGILSNGDNGMLTDAVASAGLATQLDLVLSVDAVKVFKTSPRAYELVLTAAQVRPSEVVFVSSNRWDVAGAAAFGFTPVWVNRLGLPDEYPGLEPVLVVGSLSELA
jgi:2-haloacid dehalogenase